MQIRKLAAVAFGGLALVATACNSSSNKSASSTTAPAPTVPFVPEPSVQGTSVTVPPPTTTTAAPAAAPVPAPAQPVTRIVTRTIIVPPSTTAPPKVYSGTVNGPIDVVFVPLPASSGGVQIPNNQIARSVTEAQAILGTATIPAWIAQFPFNTQVLVFSFRGIQDGALYPCTVGRVTWRTQTPYLAVDYGLLCYGGTPPQSSPNAGRSLEYSVYPIPAVAAAGITTIVQV